MKKRKSIQFKALLLLLVYLFSNSPSILFHQHKKEIASYDKATPCEKEIYYSDQDENCTHKTHIGKETEKCRFCDKHTVLPHSLQTFFTCFFITTANVNYSYNKENYFFLTPSIFSNRGPPSVSSLTF